MEKGITDADALVHKDRVADHDHPGLSVDGVGLLAPTVFIDILNSKSNDCYDGG